MEISLGLRKPVLLGLFTILLEPSELFFKMTTSIFCSIGLWIDCDQVKYTSNGNFLMLKEFIGIFLMLKEFIGNFTWFEPNLPTPSNILILSKTSIPR
jgi:uncharacterized membrane protein